MIYNLLEIVQQTLGAMGSDEVSNYNDTTESLQVANIAKRVYYDIATDLGLPEHEALFELNASGDANKPTLMTAPSNCVKVFNVKYNWKLDTDTYNLYKDVTYKPFDEFLRQSQSLADLTTGIGTMTFTSNSESFEVIYRNDKMPQYYTTFDDRTYIFDSYDADTDTTLQKSKTMVQGIVYPSWTMNNTFAPDLNPAAFSYYLNKVIDRAYIELKQQQNINAAQEARRQKIILQKRKTSSPDRPAQERMSRHYGRK